MASIRDIIRKNNETFYDYRSKKKHSVFPRLIFFIILAIIVFLVFQKLDKDFIAAILTVQSVLLGFSFSVLFFLVSGPTSHNATDLSLEKKYQANKLDTLANELFYNVAYYNTITIANVIVALVFLLPTLDLPSFLNNYDFYQCMYSSVIAPNKTVFSNVWERFVVSVFFCTFTESIYTFYRIVRRVNFYFSEKLALQSK